MCFLHDGTGWALYCLAHGELAWHFQNHIQGWLNDLNILLSCFREKMPAPSLPHPDSFIGAAAASALFVFSADYKIDPSLFER